jgi:hypothetical protein
MRRRPGCSTSEVLKTPPDCSRKSRSCCREIPRARCTSNAPNPTSPARPLRTGPVLYPCPRNSGLPPGFDKEPKSMQGKQSPQLSHAELLQLKRWNTPSVYNGWEAITKHDRRTHWNLEETRDFMPQMGPMVGCALTLVIEPSNPQHPQKNPAGWMELSGMWRKCAMPASSCGQTRISCCPRRGPGSTVGSGPVHGRE